MYIRANTIAKKHYKKGRQTLPARIYEKSARLQLIWKCPRWFSQVTAPCSQRPSHFSVAFKYLDRETNFSVHSSAVLWFLRRLVDRRSMLLYSVSSPRENTLSLLPSQDLEARNISFFPFRFPLLLRSSNARRVSTRAPLNRVTRRVGLHTSASARGAFRKF